MCLLALTGGCSEPPWKRSQPGATTAAPTVSATPTPTPTPSAAPVRNDLSKGSLKRELGAGGINLAVVYYSTLDLGQWTPQATKPFTISASGKFADGSKQDIFLTAVTVRIDVAGADGPLTAPEPLNDDANVSPGYLVKSPNAYGQVFSLPSVEPDATSVTLNITYQLLAPTAPKSKTYFKQSANDTIVIALATS